MKRSLLLNTYLWKVIIYALMDFYVEENEQATLFLLESTCPIFYYMFHKAS